MRTEAIAVGANAIVDVKLRTIRLKSGDSMDFTVLGTAVRIDGLSPSQDPVIATVPALEFVCLLKAGIIPVGIAVGAFYDWLWAGFSSQNIMRSWTSQPVPKLTDFWESVRRRALRELHRDTEKAGDGVLAHTHFGQLLRVGEDDKARYLGRHIVIGTIVHTRKSSCNVDFSIQLVIDMAKLSPLSDGFLNSHDIYPTSDEGGLI